MDGRVKLSEQGWDGMSKASREGGREAGNSASKKHFSEENCGTKKSL